MKPVFFPSCYRNLTDQRFILVKDLEYAVWPVIRIPKPHQVRFAPIPGALLER
jgi:hypothetical protein